MPVVVATPSSLYPGGTWSSGTAPVSGITTSAYQGPWYIEEQSLNIDYHRIPGGELSSTTMSLSGNSITYRNTGTKLIAEVKAKYSSRKDWTTYNTSTAQVPQTFEIVAASSDTRGNTYGVINASSLGPQGSIITKTPFYRRVPWNDLSGHSEMTSSMTATTYFGVNQRDFKCYAASSASSGPAIPQTIDQTKFNDSWEHWFIDMNSKGYLEYPDNGPFLVCEYLYWLPGGYSVSQESLRKIIAMIDEIGSKITDKKLYTIPANWDCTRAWAAQDTGISEYSIYRHKYS
jgi:hypothetical protein